MPAALITGGVHGYETSGVMGALEFLETRADAYAGRVNLLAAPCVSPWAFERVNRWTFDAVDPNRNFRADGPAREATSLMALVEPWLGQFLLHIDLHETTDSDESELRPALAARDGKPFEPGLIPDGFYLVADALPRALTLHPRGGSQAGSGKLRWRRISVQFDGLAIHGPRFRPRRHRSRRSNPGSTRGDVAFRDSRTDRVLCRVDAVAFVS